MQGIAPLLLSVLSQFLVRTWGRSEEPSSQYPNRLNRSGENREQRPPWCGTRRYTRLQPVSHLSCSRICVRYAGSLHSLLHARPQKHQLPCKLVGLVVKQRRPKEMPTKEGVMKVGMMVPNYARWFRGEGIVDTCEKGKSWSWMLCALWTMSSPPLASMLAWATGTWIAGVQCPT